MHKKIRALPLPAALLAAASLARAATTPATWDGSSANWTDSAHWSLPAPDYPDADHPPSSTYAITINSGTLNLQGGSYLVSEAYLAGGVLTNGTLTVASAISVTGPNSVLLNSGMSLHNLVGGTLTLSGQIDTTQTPSGSSVVNDGLLVLSSGTIYNLPLTNAGAVNVVGSVDVSQLTTTGSLTIASTGSLNIIGPLTVSSGSITIANGGMLQVGQLNVTAPTAINGDLTVQQATINGDASLNGTLTITDLLTLNANLSVDTLTLKGTLTGAGSLNVSGVVTLSRGVINTTNTLSLSDLYLVGGELRSHLLLDTGAVTNTPSSVASGLNLLSHAVLENKGTFNAHAGTFTFSTSSATFSPQFINSGHLIVDPGADQVFFLRSSPNNTQLPDTYPAFLNSGTVDINSGTLYIHAADDGNTRGTFNVNAGATLRLDALLTFGPTSTIQGAGNVLVQSDSQYDLYPLQPVTFAGNYAITGDTTIDSMQAIFNTSASTNSATLTNAQISGAGTLTVGGNFFIYKTLFTGFSMVLTGTGSISESIVPASLEIAGTTTLSVSSTPTLPALANTAITTDPTGILVLTGSSLQLADTASITNNGTLNLRSAIVQGYQSAPLHPKGLITNNGTLTTTSTSALTSSITFNNNGLIEVLRGSHFILVSPGTDAPASSILVDAGGSLQGFRPLLAGSLTNNGYLQFTGNGKFTLGLSPSSFAFTNNGSITLGSQSAALSITAAFADTTSSSIDLGNSGTLTFNSPFNMLGSVSGSGTFSLLLPPNTTDPGSTLSGPYSITGTTSLSNAHATFAPSANASTATLLLSNNATLSGNLTITTSLTLDSSTIDAALTTPAANISIKQSTTPAPTLDNTTLTIAATHTASVDTDATLHLQHNATLINNGTLSAAHALTIDSNATAGTFKNAGTLTISAATTTLAADLTFQNPGTVDIQSGALLLAAPQDPLTTSLFTVESAATLQLTANYAFSTATDPTLSGDGLIIINPNTTLTLAIDTAFSGTIQVEGTLILTGPRDPANQNLQPRFTVLPPPTPVPEPTTLPLLALAAPLLLRRRARS